MAATVFTWDTWGCSFDPMLDRMGHRRSQWRNVHTFPDRPIELVIPGDSGRVSGSVVDL